MPDSETPIAPVPATPSRARAAPIPPARPPRPGRSWARAARWAVAGVAAVYRAPVRVALGWPFSLKERTNVLIMGLDRTVSDKNPAIVYPVSRTDTLIAATFDPASRHVYLLSVPRDTRASIPGHGATKINAAHAWGGQPLSTRTAENLLGVRFPYYIEITERGLVRLIDAVGGVNVHVDKDLNYDDNWDGLHIHLKKGYRRLGGKAAMEFARFRHDALGDIGRIQRQQEVMNALLDELRRPRIAIRMNQILGVFREDIKTNLTEEQLIALALFGSRLPSGGLVRETLPGRFGHEDWLPDAARDRDVVTRMFYGVDAGTLAGTTVEVITDPASREAAADAEARLAALGMRIAGVRTAASPGSTTVVIHRGDPRVAGIVAALLGGAQIAEGSWTDGPDLTIQLANATVGGPAIALPR
jgi:polyisoprenyl-teichoic acid--peptidoglycan teichoic acid transferase